MDSLDARTLARMRAAGHPMSDLPDDAILRTTTFALCRLEVAMRELGSELATPLRRVLEHFAR